MSVRRVLKWAMVDPEMAFDMPGDSEVVAVHVQDEVPTLWTLGSVDAPLSRREFVAFGTGHPIDDDGLAYAGTAHGIDLPKPCSTCSSGESDDRPDGSYSAL